MTTISSTMIGQINLLNPTTRVDAKTGPVVTNVPAMPASDVSQRTAAPTVFTENAARGVTSQVTSNFMAMMLQQADQVTLSAGGVNSTTALLSVGDAADGNGDTVSILDVLDEMQAIIARYAPQDEDAAIGNDLPRDQA